MKAANLAIGFCLLSAMCAVAEEKPLAFFPGIAAPLRAGDVDADGFEDILSIDDAYSVTVWSGKNGAAIYSYSFDAASFSPSAAGDVNGDGFDDFMIGWWSSYQGHVGIFSGKTGVSLHTFFPYAWSATTEAGDVNVDGFDDFIIVGYDGYGQSVDVFSGRTFNVIHHFDGDVGGAAGDVDHDGYSDVIVGASWSSLAKVFSGKSGKALLEVGKRVTSVGPMGDVNQDGYDDIEIYVAANQSPNSSLFPSSGFACVLSGRDASSLYVFHGNYSVRNVGDVNADGSADIAIRDEVLSGRDGVLLHDLSSWRSAWAQQLGDFDHDGRDDFMAAVSMDRSIYSYHSGPVVTVVFSGR